MISEALHGAGRMGLLMWLTICSVRLNSLLSPLSLHHSDHHIVKAWDDFSGAHNEVQWLPLM